MESLIFTLILLLLMLFAWKYLWQDYALDKLRDDLFSIRNDLFDFAYSNNEISFDHKLYLAFENILNNSIRYGYKLSFMSAVFFNLFVKMKFKDIQVKSQIQVEFEDMINSVKNDKTRKTLSDLKLRFEISIFNYFLRTSPTLFILFVFNFFWVVISELSKKAAASIFTSASLKAKNLINNRIINKIEYEAEALA